MADARNIVHSDCRYVRAYIYLTFVEIAISITILLLRLFMRLLMSSSLLKKIAIQSSLDMSFLPCPCSAILHKKI